MLAENSHSITSHAIRLLQPSKGSGPTMTSTGLVKTRYIKVVLKFQDTSDFNEFLL